MRYFVYSPNIEKGIGDNNVAEEMKENQLQ